MINHKNINVICVLAIIVACILTLVGMGVTQNEYSREDVTYMHHLFDDSRVHTINILVEDWKDFVETATEEEYIAADVEIDGELFKQVGLRAKGNNSLTLTSEYDLIRHSLKIEFDYYIEGGNYYGLDKLSLDASFQDNSYLKTYMVYDMMRSMGVPAPLCSYVQVKINGRTWGLFLAIEEIEEAFALRNFGKNHGKLYKPDYQSLNHENADVALRYIDEHSSSYPNIFDNAKFKVNEMDKKRVIKALKVLDEGINLDEVIDIDEVLRYFCVQVFVMNWDSYLGRTGHNYYLYEHNGKLSILPWDYNLSFGTYALGMTNPIKDPNVLINYPVDTPAAKEVMLKRPLYHHVMKNDVYFKRYHTYMKAFIEDYFLNGYFETKLFQVANRIDEYVKNDPTAFCSYEEHRIAIQTLAEICTLRSKSVLAQLEDKLPSTFKEQQQDPNKKIDASHVRIDELGDFEDLRQAKSKHAKILSSFDE